MQNQQLFFCRYQESFLPLSWSWSISMNTLARSPGNLWFYNPRDEQGKMLPEEVWYLPLLQQHQYVVGMRCYSAYANTRWHARCSGVCDLLSGVCSKSVRISYGSHVICVNSAQKTQIHQAAEVAPTVYVQETWIRHLKSSITKKYKNGWQSKELWVPTTAL